jgi:hypothetical protein
MNTNKTELNSTSKLIDNIISEIEEIQDGLIQRLFLEDQEINYESFYSRQKELCKRIEIIASITLKQKMDYYAFLEKRKDEAIKEEDYLKADILKKRQEYFHIGFLERMSKKYL